MIHGEQPLLPALSIISSKLHGSGGETVWGLKTNEIDVLSDSTVAAAGGGGKDIELVKHEAFATKL